jgi:nucleotide-binding universal stress UspA family protein
MESVFPRVLVPYDGSEPADHALAYGIAFARSGAALDVVHVVDETSVLSMPTTDVSGFDPLPLMDALEESAKALVDGVQQRCRDAGVQATVEVVHEQPVRGICDAAKQHGDRLIVMGTHGRKGLERALLGSTTDGVLREGTTPVLTVRADMPAPAEAFFRKVLLAVDDSDPSDAAVALAAQLAYAAKTTVVICTVYDPADVFDSAANAGLDPTPLLDEERAEATTVAQRAYERGGFPKELTTIRVVEGEPAHGIITTARESAVEAIVMGSHGRRGLQRLLLGSVAEHVVRESPCPVLVVHPEHVA